MIITLWIVLGIFVYVNIGYLLSYLGWWSGVYKHPDYKLDKKAKRKIEKAQRRG